MTGRPGTLLAVILAVGALSAAGPALGQTLEDAQRRALERQNLERRERDLATDIRERNARLQSLEREIGALKRDKASDGGESARSNAKINRLRDERSRLHKANQADAIKRNRLRGRR